MPLPPARGLIAGKKVDALAVSSATRAKALPDVPTTIEAGYPNSEYNFWMGMFAAGEDAACDRRRGCTRRRSRR